MAHKIKVFKSGMTTDVTYVQVGTSWHELHDGQTTPCGAPDPAGVYEVGEPGPMEFLGSGVAAPAKFLPTTLFAINVAERTSLDAEIEIHERKAHGIAPLFGAPRRTLNEVSQLSSPLAIPLTRKFSETNIVVGAQLTRKGTGEVAVVLEVGPLLAIAIAIRPSDPTPHSARIRQESSRKFTHCPSCELFGDSWVRATPALAPLPQGNCEPLLPGTVTDRGLVISLTAENVVIESNSGHTSSYPVYYNPLVSPRMFIGTEPPITVLTPGVPVTMLAGELWKSHTGSYIMARPNYRAAYFDDVSLRAFWGGESTGSSPIQDSYTQLRDGRTLMAYPCAISASQLPSTFLAIQDTGLL